MRRADVRAWAVTAVLALIGGFGVAACGPVGCLSQEPVGATYTVKMETSWFGLSHVDVNYDVDVLDGQGSKHSPPTPHRGGAYNPPLVKVKIFTSISVDLLIRVAKDTRISTKHGTECKVSLLKSDGSNACRPVQRQDNPKKQFSTCHLFAEYVPPPSRNGD